MATGKQGVGGLWWPGKGAGKLWWCCAAGFGFLTASSGRGGSTIWIYKLLLFHHFPEFKSCFLNLFYDGFRDFIDAFLCLLSIF